MQKSLSKAALSASIALALAFTLSCSSDDGDGDGDKNHGSYGPGCQISSIACWEQKDGMTVTEKSCSREDEEFKPEGCPTDWNLRCIHPSIDYYVTYFYQSDMYDAAISAGYRSCVKK